MKIVGGLFALNVPFVEYADPLLAVPLPGCRTNAQRFCSALGKSARCVTWPVMVVPARVGVTCPVVSGIGDSSHLSV